MSEALPDQFASARLVMRPQRVEDAEALFEAYSDEALMTWWSTGPHADVAHTRRYLTERNGPDWWQGWVMLREGAVIGTLAAHESRPGVLEVGYLVIRRYWGQGYAREGVARLIDLAFATGHRRVMADTDPDNAASNKLLTSLGFTCEGRLRGEWETHIGIRDSLIWGLLKDEWPPTR